MILDMITKIISVVLNGWSVLVVNDYSDLDIEI